MKQKQLSILAASLIAAFAVNVANAGNVASSNPQIAREVITSDLQNVKAPEASYAFQGDLNTASQNQTMQVQLILTGGGKWNAAAAAASIGVYEANGTTIIPTSGAVTPTVSADGTTLFATLTFVQDSIVHKTPIVSFNRASVAQSNLTNLFSVVGTVVACDKSSTQLPFKIKHFTGVAPGSTTLAVAGINGAFEDESARAASNNNNVLMSFPTNIGVVVASSVGPAKVDPAGGNLTFTTGVVGATNATLISTTLLTLGNITLKQQASGYDSGLTQPYLLADTITAPAGVKGVTAAAGVVGAVEVASFDVTVSAPLGFATGATAYLSSSPSCGAAITSSTTAFNTARTIATLSVPSTSINATFGVTGLNPVYVCYNVAGATAAIPASTFATTAVLTKAPAALPLPEQNNSCSGPLFPLSGGVKIDVRNYATLATSGWTSVLRLINPSEVNTAVVYAQLIHADGTYGNWGPIATLAPRAVSNLDSSVINAALVNVPASVTPGAPGPVANAQAGAGDRLRISAEGVGSLRVQNYLYNPSTKNFIEASSTQGVDFEGTADRAPASEGQYQDQDAQTGLKK